MAKLTLEVVEGAAPDREVNALVVVHSARPGAEVTLTLRQTRGNDPLYSASRNMRIDATGSGAVTFSGIRLVSSGSSNVPTLLVTGSDANNDYYTADALSLDFE